MRRTNSPIVDRPKPDHALAGPHREVQIGNRPIQQGPFVGREQFGIVGRLFFANLVGELAQLQALRLQHVADFDQRRFAEVLAREQFLLAAPRQIAERHDAHLLQAIAAADRQFEVGDRNAEHLAEPILAATRVFVVVHVAGGVGILLEQPSPRMIREYVEDPPVALPRFFVLLHVFVQHAQVQQRADVRRKLRGRALVQIAGVAIVAVPIVLQRQAEQCAGVTAVGSDRSLQERDRFRRIAAHRRDGRGTLIQILGRLLDRPGQLD